MNAAVMMKRMAEASPGFKARIAGVLSLLSLLATVFGEFFVRRLEFAGDSSRSSGMRLTTHQIHHRALSSAPTAVRHSSMA